MSKFFAVYHRKRRKLAFGTTFWMHQKHFFYLSTNINVSAEGKKEEELATTKKKAGGDFSI